jgi:hypothetical protein
MKFASIDPDSLELRAVDAVLSDIPVFRCREMAISVLEYAFPRCSMCRQLTDSEDQCGVCDATVCSACSDGSFHDHCDGPNCRAHGICDDCLSPIVCACGDLDDRYCDECMSDIPTCDSCGEHMCPQCSNEHRSGSVHCNDCDESDTDASDDEQDGYGYMSD